MIKNYKYIILSYGLFLGWLLAFPYNGQILEHLVSLHNASIASYSLIYTVTPAIFLIIYPFLKVKEKHAKSMMIWSLIISLLGTLIIFTTDSFFWYPAFALMGIFSVLFIISWSYFYTMEVPIAQKIPVMALVIITGNSIHYLINIVHSHLSIKFILIIMLALLSLSYLATVKTVIKDKITVQLEHEPFPTKLIFLISLFLFAINLNGGLTFHVISPSLIQLSENLFTYYGILPYIITLGIMFFYGNKTSFMLPVFLGISFLGLAYLSFGLVNDNWFGYFITETLMQSGWALLDLSLWTLFGLVASIYGRPLKISGYAFLANLFAVFAGGLLGVRILAQLNAPYLISVAFAIAIIFISLVIMPWLNETIEKDLRSKLIKAINQNNLQDKNILFSANLAQIELLTPREKEVSELLLQGYTNIQIADMLHISENTIKTHTRNIYSKLNVANKRELIQLAFSSVNS